MKRRLEELPQLDASGGYPHLSMPLSPQRLTPRTLSSVGGHTFTPPTISQSSEFRSNQAFASLATSMQAVTPTQSIHVHSGAITPPVSTLTPAQQQQQQQQIQRLKVEDALSYLDMVKYKFGDQPQVYNDFLDIMKEFKTQSIDTPGVIDRVSTLFNGHPELIVGFNTFLPPGYKIEVKTHEQGYSFQVQVSISSPSSSTTTLVPAGPAIHHSTAMPVSTPLILTNPTLVPASSIPPVAPLSHQATSPPTITEVQVQQVVSQALIQADNQQPTQSQPVEFNHAINYVNKIKNRFQGQPDKYKRFLEILHTYQKEQRLIKEGMGMIAQTPGTKQLTEAEVYSQVAQLFENQDDLLTEFGQFLPDATNHQTQLARRVEELPPVIRKPLLLTGKVVSSFSNNNTAESASESLVVATTSAKIASSSSVNPSPPPPPPPVPIILPPPITVPPPITLPPPPPPPPPPPSTTQAETSGLKRSASSALQLATPSTSTSPSISYVPALKKIKTSSSAEPTLPEVGKYGSLNDYSFFDKVRKSLRSQEVFENFLRCLNLFNHEVISKGELMQMVSPFLGRSPELFRWFKDYVSQASDHPYLNMPSADQRPSTPPLTSNMSGALSSKRLAGPDRLGAELSEIDLSSCRRVGTSYCAPPTSGQQESYEGRTALGREVLNDTWVSFPSWSEESTFVTSKKTQYEEYIYKCEDERFELDVIIESNLSTIRVLEGVLRKLERLSPDEAAKFTLDDRLGGDSETIHKRSVMRLYGPKGVDIIEGLKKIPSTTVPLILKRLKGKDEEWREAQKGFNKIWREQNEKYYLKSLDHLGMNFKPNDIKGMRTKALFHDIENCYDEKQEQVESGYTNYMHKPQMKLRYNERLVLDDAINLLIHHVKRQTSINKEDKQRIKQMLRQMIPDLFYHPRQELSEDERGTDNKSRSSLNSNKSGHSSKRKSDEKRKDHFKNDRLPSHALSKDPDEHYTLFFGNGPWYLFLRLHHILCERLGRIYKQANIQIEEENRFKKLRSEADTNVLRLKPRPELLVGIEFEDYYTTFLDMVKNLLDGNMEATIYEDMLREMFGIHAYIAFTMDKVITYAVRQLQILVSEDPCIDCMDIFLEAQKHNGTGGPCSTASKRAVYEATYLRKVETALTVDNCYKFCIYKLDFKMTIDLLYNDADETETTSQDDQWSAYVERYGPNDGRVKDEPMYEEDDEDNEPRKPTFLARNIRQWKERARLNQDTKIKTSDQSICQISLNSYKAVFVLDEGRYLYKKGTLHKAKQHHELVSYRKNEKFRIWHHAWELNHVSPSHYTFAERWMMGKLPDYKVNNTILIRDNSLKLPPYHTFSRYKLVQPIQA